MGINWSLEARFEVQVAYFLRVFGAAWSRAFQGLSLDVQKIYSKYL